MALTTTVAGATSDSYISLADATTELEFKQSDTWADAADSLKEACLKAAVDVLDNLHWKRPRATQTQALRLPSSQMKDDAGDLYIPAQIGKAQSLLALMILDDPDSFAGTGLAEAVSVNGAWSIKDRAGSSDGQELPAEVMRLIDRWLYKWGPDVSTWNSAARTWD